MQPFLEIVEKIKDSFTLSTYLSRTISLTRKGKEFLGLCPFHGEKTPSFTVNDVKQFYHCFGCGAHGDIIKFVMQLRGWDFNEAVENLANEAGIPLPKPNVSTLKQQKEQKSLYEVLNLACEWFKKQLFTSHGKEALDYLYNRGINTQVIFEYSIGYAPNDRHALYNYLKKEGISKELMIEAGLLIQPTQEEGGYDRFRSRIIFPIMDIKGRVVAFGGRALGDFLPKYLNSPETKLFKKGEMVYGENFAREAAYKSAKLIIVEGYIDAISLWTSGIKETVATLGTAITEHHLFKLWKICNEPIICLDGDTAGMRAMQKVAELALPFIKPGCSLRFVLLPNKYDPDEAIKKLGVESFKDLVQNNLTLSEMLWLCEIKSLPKKVTPEVIAVLEKRLFDLLEKIKDNTLKSNYKKFFLEKLWESFKTYKAKKTIKDVSGQASQLLVAFTENITPLERQERYVLALIISFPELLNYSYIEEEFTLMEFVNDQANQLRVAILETKNYFKEEIEKEKFNKYFNTYLEKERLLPNLKYWYGSIASDVINNFKNHDIKLVWSHVLNCYHIELLKDERKKALDLLTEDALNRAMVLGNQINELEKEINNIADKLFN